MAATKTVPTKKLAKSKPNSGTTITTRDSPVVLPPTKTASAQKNLVPSTSGSSSSSLGISLLVAFTAFAFGIVTPPVLHELHAKSSSVYVTGSQRGRVTLENSLQQNYPCTQERLEEFWHDQPVQGFHIVCLNLDEGGNLFVKYYKNGRRNDSPEQTMGSNPVAWPTLRSNLVENLGLSVADDLHQPWALFTPQGERALDEVSEEEELGLFARTMSTKVGMLLVYQGGQFLWPGVRIGFRRQIPLYSIIPEHVPMDKGNWTVTLETLSLKPLVVSVDGFLSPEECQHIQTKAEPSMQYSGVVLHDADEGRPASDFRTSKTTFLSSNGDNILVDIDYRTASLTRIPRRHQEHVQVLRYGPTEHYTAHHDYFDPALYQNDRNTLRLIGNGRRNRLATVFWYLSDVEEGGRTVFPRFNGGRERNFDDCETGLLVKPETGKVIIFYSLNFDGSRDHHSLHGACPVKQGVKWAANKWIWNEAMPYVSE